jgi:hypothetical protein
MGLTIINHSDIKQGMTWIRESEFRGMGEAQRKLAALHQKQLDQAHFSGENPVAPEQIATFLEPFKAPIEAIAQDLQGAGYVVKPTGPEYLYDWNSRDDSPRNGKKYETKYALTRTKDESWSSHGDNSLTAYYVFGLEWGIQRPDGTDLGTIMLLPRVNERTHFAAAEFRGIPNHKLVEYRSHDLEYSTDASVVNWSDPEQQVNMVGALQTVIGSWIARAESLSTPEVRTAGAIKAGK